METEREESVRDGRSPLCPWSSLAEARGSRGLTCVFWKTDRQRGLLDLLSEQILLVEEEDDGGVDEELVVTDGVKEHE